MVQADMLAFHVEGEPPQLGLPDLYFMFHSSQLSDLNSDNRIGSPLATQLVANVSALYSPELHVGFTPVSHFFISIWFAYSVIASGMLQRPSGMSYLTFILSIIPLSIFSPSMSKVSPQPRYSSVRAEVCYSALFNMDT